MISSSAANATGLFLYNASDNTITQLYTGGYAWQYYQMLGDKYLIGSSGTNTGILLYNPSDNTVAQVYAGGKEWKYFDVSGNDCYISNVKKGDEIDGTYTLFYNSTDNSVKIDKLYIEVS